MLPKITTIFYWILQLQLLQCSYVIDKNDQDGIVMSDYCPKMPYCIEGAHVMCMYYNPDRLAGPRCSNFKNVSITSDVADILLDVINEIRGKVAMGKETGQGNVTLPRGYGMFKLQWDKELATFAQVLANTCILRHDLCRATKKFSDPGQAVSIIRFTIPDWFPRNHRGEFKEAGLNENKIIYAGKEAFNSWYRQKQYVTLDMIKNVPDWLAQPSRTQGAMFLQLVDGKATHIGCGLSAYTEYGYTSKNILDDTIFHLIHVVCNFSSKPKKGTAAYTLKPNGKRCGCPEGSYDDDRCLCSEGEKVPEKTCSKNQDCNPAVVLLPIFTVEDGPPNLIERSGDFGTVDDTTRRRKHILNLQQKSSQDVGKNALMQRRNVDHLYRNKIKEHDMSGHMFDDHYQNPEPEWNANEIAESVPFAVPQRKERYEESGASYRGMHDSGSQYYMPPIRQMQKPSFSLQNIRQHSTPNKRISKYPDVKKRHFDRVRTEPPQSHFQLGRENYNRYLPKRKIEGKPSIFSRSPKFELPQGERRSGVSSPPHTYDHKSGSKKKDVAPRKDFSKAQELLDTYMNKKHRKSDSHSKHDDSTTKSPQKNKRKPKVEKKESKSKQKNSKSESHKNEVTTEETVTEDTNINKFIKNKFHYQGFSKKDKVSALKNLNEDSDRKLMSLLDTLEQEVKHIELNVNEKEIFDAKIRKIYGKVLGKSQTLSPVLNKEKPETKGEIQHHIKDSSNSKQIDKKDTKKDEFLNYNEEVEDHLMMEHIEEPYKKNTDMKIFETEDQIKKLRLKRPSEYSGPKSLYARPLPRDQNSLIPFSDKEEDQFDIKNSINEPYDRGINKNQIDNDNTYENENHFKKHKIGYHREKKDDRIEYSKPYKREELKMRYPYADEMDKRDDMPRFQYKNNDYVSRSQNKNFYEERHLKQIEDDAMKNKYIDEKLRDRDRYTDYGFDPKVNKEKYDDYDYDKNDTEDPLGLDRRKFYQEKLDNLERKLHVEHMSRHRQNHVKERSQRLVRGRDRLQEMLRQYPKKPSPYYMPDRTRSLHGF